MSQRNDEIKAAIKDLDKTVDGNFTKAGLPDVKALEKVVGEITATERNDAWAEIQAEEAATKAAEEAATKAAEEAATTSSPAPPTPPDAPAKSKGKKYFVEDKGSISGTGRGIITEHMEVTSKDVAKGKDPKRLDVLVSKGLLYKADKPRKATAKASEEVTQGKQRLGREFKGQSQRRFKKDY